MNPINMGGNHSIRTNDPNSADENNNSPQKKPGWFNTRAEKVTGFTDSTQSIGATIAHPKLEHQKTQFLPQLAINLFYPVTPGTPNNKTPISLLIKEILSCDMPKLLDSSIKFSYSKKLGNISIDIKFIYLNKSEFQSKVDSESLQVYKNISNDTFDNNQIALPELLFLVILFNKPNNSKRLADNFFNNEKTNKPYAFGSDKIKSTLGNVATDFESRKSNFNKDQTHQLRLFLKNMQISVQNNPSLNITQDAMLRLLAGCQGLNLHHNVLQVLLQTIAPENLISFDQTRLSNLEIENKCLSFNSEYLIFFENNGQNIPFILSASDTYCLHEIKAKSFKLQIKENSFRIAIPNWNQFCFYFFKNINPKKQLSEQLNYNLTIVNGDICSSIQLIDILNNAKFVMSIPENIQQIYTKLTGDAQFAKLNSNQIFLFNLALINSNDTWECLSNLFIPVVFDKDVYLKQIGKDFIRIKNNIGALEFATTATLLNTIYNNPSHDISTSELIDIIFFSQIIYDHHGKLLVINTISPIDFMIDTNGIKRNLIEKDGNYFTVASTYQILAKINEQDNRSIFAVTITDYFIISTKDNRPSIDLIKSSCSKITAIAETTLVRHYIFNPTALTINQPNTLSVTSTNEADDYIPQTLQIPKSIIKRYDELTVSKSIKCPTLLIATFIVKTLNNDILIDCFKNRVNEQNPFHHHEKVIMLLSSLDALTINNKALTQKEIKHKDGTLQVRVSYLLTIVDVNTQYVVIFDDTFTWHNNVAYLTQSSVDIDIFNCFATNNLIYLISSTNDIERNCKIYFSYVDSEIHANIDTTPVGYSNFVLPDNITHIYKQITGFKINGGDIHYPNLLKTLIWFNNPELLGNGLVEFYNTFPDNKPYTLEDKNFWSSFNQDIQRIISSPRFDQDSQTIIAQQFAGIGWYSASTPDNQENIAIALLQALCGNQVIYHHHIKLSAMINQNPDEVNFNSRNRLHKIQQIDGNKATISTAQKLLVSINGIELELPFTITDTFVIFPQKLANDTIEYKVELEQCVISPLVIPETQVKSPLSRHLSLRRILG